MINKSDPYSSVAQLRILIARRIDWLEELRVVEWTSCSNTARISNRMLFDSARVNVSFGLTRIGHLQYNPDWLCPCDRCESTHEMRIDPNSKVLSMG